MLWLEYRISPIDLYIVNLVPAGSIALGSAGSFRVSGLHWGSKSPEARHQGIILSSHHAGSRDHTPHVSRLQDKCLRLLNHLTRSSLECWSLYKRSHEVCIPFHLTFLPQNHICEILSCYCSSWSNHGLLYFYFLRSIWLERNHIKYYFYCW